MDLPIIQLTFGTTELKLGVTPFLIGGQDYDSIQFGSAVIILVQFEIRNGDRKVIARIPFRRCPISESMMDQLWRPFVCASHGLALRPLYFRSMTPGESFLELHHFLSEPLASSRSRQRQFLGELYPTTVIPLQSFGTILHLIASAFLLASEAWSQGGYVYHTNDYFGALTLTQIKDRCQQFGLSNDFPGFVPHFKARVTDPKELNSILRRHGVVFPHHQEVSCRKPMNARFLALHRGLQDLGEALVDPTFELSLGELEPYSLEGEPVP